MKATSVRFRSGAIQWLLMFLATGWAWSQPVAWGDAPGAGGRAGWPALPDRDGSVDIPAQEWPHRPGPRLVKVYVHFPRGTREAVGPGTGLMLSLHNWGGSQFVGTADPVTLAERYDLVVLGLDYLQSGAQASIHDPEPYDFGWLQSLDALRALEFVRSGLRERGISFADGRIYATGGSGGGNVTLMANKLAPRTFACIIDLCGMAKLSDDIGFNLPGGSPLNARYQRDPRSPFFLTPDAQQLHFVGNPDHLREMRRLEATSRVVVVHGVDDDVCPIADAREMVANMQQAGFAVDAHFVAKADLDGRAFTGTGHALGDRTQIVLRVADKYLKPQGAESAVRKGACDFERRETLRYRTANGAFVISYAKGYPVGRFELATPPTYTERADLSYILSDSGERHPVRNASDWERRRQQVLAGFQGAAGPLPAAAQQVPLDLQVQSETASPRWLRRHVTFVSEPGHRVTAWLFLPVKDAPVPGTRRPDETPPRRPAMLCLHQTTSIGKDEPAGLGGNPDLHYALELADRGYVVLAPDYPSFGEHVWDFATHGPPDENDPYYRTVGHYESGTMKAIWDNVRAVDLLRSLTEVDPQRIGCLGHSLGGHSAIFSALFEPRIRVVVSSCGFSSLDRDDIPSWTGPRYMPRIASVFGNEAARVPFDFTELVAALAPRPFLAVAATGDDDFDVQGVRDVLNAARPIYDLYGRSENLSAVYPEAPHSFPREAREAAYQFLEKHL